MSANATTSAPTGRKKVAQGKDRSDAALGNPPQNTSSPEGAKERRPLPSGWRWAQMSEVCTRVQDGTHFSPKEQTPTGDFKYITAKNIKHWGLDLSELTYVPEHVHREIYKRCNVEKGDVLYIKDGVTTGIATVNTLDEEFSLLSSVALLKPRRDILDSLFLKYYLNSPEGFRNMTGQMTGTAIKRLILLKIKAALVPVAPIAEQRRIVAEIEKQFTRLEAGVAALRRVQANLKRYRAAVLKAACEGKLVPTEAELATENTEKRNRSVSASSVHSVAKNPRYETGAELLARILTERRQNWQGRGKYKEPAAPDTANLPSLPDGWTWATVEQISSWLPGSIQSGPFGSQLLHSEFVDQGILAIGIDNVRDGAFSIGANHRITKQKFKQLEKFAARPRDVLVTVMATVGRVCVLPDDLETSIVTKHCYRITPSHTGMNSRFLSLCLRADSATRQYLFGNIRGQTRAGINGGILKLAPVPLPPLAEQTRIVAEVERRLSVVEELESVVTANLARSQRLRQSILQQAFSGAF